ncbi:fimbrial protein [Escherichia coli]|uniref:F4 family fimbrial subunit n=1 Tax=Escherichia coli TaxID=562 RepID=UPI000D0E671D|nr:fimbrial protein [Escherichia coli]NJV49043.1 fimbrial protein [Escherichia coli]HCH7292438.1 fimbrial protein [Escherichia coli]
MKKTTLWLLLASLVPTVVMAWNTPGDDFSGELKLVGTVTSTRNPWVWKSGDGNENLEVKLSNVVHNRMQGIPVSLPAMTILQGKTIFNTSTGREGLSPRINFGKGNGDFSIIWTEPGFAEVSVPVTEENNAHAGTFFFRMQAVGVLRHEQNGQPIYVNMYDDLSANGLPGENRVMKSSDIPGTLQRIFSGEGPSWLQAITVSATAGVSSFSNPTLRQIEGVYGAQTVAGSGELRLNGTIPKRWHASLPVSIEYH